MIPRFTINLDVMVNSILAGNIGTKMHHKAYSSARGFPSMIKGKTLAITLVIVVLASSLFIVMPSEVNAEPYSGSPGGVTNITVYFHNLSKPVTVGSEQSLHISNTINDTASQYYLTGENVSSTHYLSLSFILYPQLSGDLKLNGTSYVWFYFAQNGSSPTAGKINASFVEVSPNGSTTDLGSGPSITTSITSPGSTPTPVLITGPTIDETIPTNYSLRIYIELIGSTSEIYSAYWGNVKGTFYYSRAIIPVSTYLNLQDERVISSTGEYNGSLSTETQNKSVTVSVNATDPLGEYDFASWPVNYNITYSSNVILSGQMQPVTAYSAFSFSRTYSFSFNYSGFAPGNYIITINATDNTAHNYYNINGALYGRDAILSIQIYIGEPPIKANFTVLDSEQRPLMGAGISIDYNNVVISTNVTNSQGLTTAALSPGNYTLLVTWEGINVYNHKQTISNSSRNFTIVTEVYSPSFIFTSIEGQTLSNTIVEIKNPLNINLPLISTGSNGTLYLNQVPYGSYFFTVFWHSSLVYSNAINVDNNTKSSIVVNAYSQVFIVTTASGNVVPDSEVTVENYTSGLILGFNTTNSEGSTSILIPYGTYSVQAYWKGILVYNNASVNLVNNNGSIRIIANIFTIEVKVVSNNGNPLANAVIKTASSSNGFQFFAETNSNGTATLTLAAGIYNISVYYNGEYELTPISQTISRNINVNSTSSVTLIMNELYPTFFSTVLFLLITIIGIIALVAVITVLILRKKYTKNRSQ